MPIRGEKVGDAYVKIHADGSDVDDDIRDSLSDSDRAYAEAGDRHSKEYSDHFDIDDIREKMRKLWGDTDKDVDQAGERQSRVYLDHWDIDVFRGRMRDLWKDVDDEVSTAGDRHGRKYTDAFDKRIDTLRHRLVDLFDDAGHAIGRASGKGSRNDFLNLIGGITQGIARLVFLIPKMAINLGTDLTRAFRNAAPDASKFATLLEGIGPTLASAAIAIGAFAAGAAVLVVALGPLISLFSLLLGILVALSSTVIFAAIGAVVALAGALVPLAAGIGVVVLAIAGMSDALKKQLGTATKDLRAEFKGLADDASQHLFADISKQASGLTDILRKMHPVIVDIADAIRGVVNNWLDRLDSPGFERFVDRIDKFLPNAVRKLGHIFGNTLSGIGGFFIASTPLINRFLDYLEKITSQFSEWANSKQGRKDIRDFLDKAGDSAHSLGHFLGSVWDLTTKLLNAGQGTGDSIFDQMADSIDKFTASLTKKDLDNWFQDSKDFASDIGDLVVELGKLVDFLDDEGNRKAISDVVELFTLLAAGAEGATVNIRLIIGIFTTLWDWFKKIKDFNPFHAVWKGVENLLDSLKHIGGSGVGFSIDFKKPNLGKIAEWFGGLAVKILDKIGLIDLLKKLPKPDMGKIVGWFAGLAGRILNAIGNILLMSKIPKPDLGRIAGFFSGLAPKVLSVVGLIDLTSHVIHNDASIAASFGGLAGKIASAIGTITVPVKGAVHAPATAMGGVFSNPQLRMFAEAGREAVVPLDLPLAQVDASVRELSAIARGLRPGTGKLPESATRRIDASGWQITVPGADPEAVAMAAINRLAAIGY